LSFLFSDDEVKEQLNSLVPEFKLEKAESQKEFIDCIKNIVTEVNRTYLNVFKLERDTSLTDMIFNAVKKGIVFTEPDTDNYHFL
jgi:division protein CdvB (Snf7/Vps24/ESCRT-III family)